MIYISLLKEKYDSYVVYSWMFHEECQTYTPLGIKMSSDKITCLLHLLGKPAISHVKPLDDVTWQKVQQTQNIRKKSQNTSPFAYQISTQINMATIVTVIRTLLPFLNQRVKQTLLNLILRNSPTFGCGESIKNNIIRCFPQSLYLLYQSYKICW